MTLDDGPVTTSAGYAVLPTHPNTVLAARGHHRRPRDQRRPIVETGVLPEELRRLAATARPDARWLSICTGAFVLAALGKLDGREATTHWAMSTRSAGTSPRCVLNPDVLYVDHGDVLTSAGNAAGIDLLLHVLRSDLGTEAANRVARGARRRAVAGRRSGPVHRPPRARRVRRRHRCDPGLGARAPRRADRPCRTWPVMRA